MAITDSQAGTRVDEVADGVYRIHTPLPPSVIPGGFSFNQYLILDDDPLLFHTGPRRMFPLVQQAIASVMPLEKLRYVACSHIEADECGSLNEMLAAAPHATPVSGQVAVTVSLQDLADRPARALADGEVLKLGRHEVTWLDAPHMPHAWECGYLMETHTQTLMCGDLFTQPGPGDAAVVESDILGPSEAFRKRMDYFSHTKNAAAILQRLAGLRPGTLACMHGSAWRGDGAALLGELARVFD
jgi:flavorubredoxin